MKGSRLRKGRNISQILCGILFGAGILMVGSSFWPLPYEIFFYLDPLIALTTMVSSGTLVPGVAVSVGMVLLTAVFGRFFCGWICPLGALIDFSEWLFQKTPAKKKKLEDPEKLSRVKFGVLALVVAASMVSVQWIYFFDPIVIMTRFTGMLLKPWQNHLMDAKTFTVLGSELFVLFVIGILMLSIFASRFWCRFLCPLGGLFGLVGTLSPFDFRQDGCKGCPRCQKQCPTGAITSHRAEDFRPAECIRCFSCLEACPSSVRTFGLHLHKRAEYRPIRMPRRTFLGWMGAGVMGATTLSSRAAGSPHAKQVLRPPFAPDEAEFLALCVRCQACVNVCPDNALQPALLQSGLYGLWSPMLYPAVGACKPDCNLCSQVCPTDAIGTFDLNTKYTVKIGTADLRKHWCVSWAENKPCGKCIPKCPTGAIAFTETAGQKRPVRIDFLLCVGCGVCEHICHQQTPGPSALKVTARGRNQASGVDGNRIIEMMYQKER